MILADTHVIVWLALDPERISSKARKAIEQARRDAEGLAICDVTLLELAMIVRKGRMRLATSLEAFLRHVESVFIVLPMTADACARAADLPVTYPKDPADRIIGATAMILGVPLVTADLGIRRTRLVPTIW
jgi:PIN domain nuclease of toxin-antitoxin system